MNADTAAAAVARFLGAEKLVFLSDVPGIFRDRSDPSTLISHLPASLCRGLIVEGVIDAGMVPKVEAALEALQSGRAKSPHCRCRDAARGAVGVLFRYGSGDGNRSRDDGFLPSRVGPP